MLLEAAGHSCWLRLSPRCAETLMPSPAATHFKQHHFLFFILTFILLREKKKKGEATGSYTNLQFIIFLKNDMKHK